ncbi:MAG: MG2 domain-containing protein [Isosphaeraceae bacterium]
MQLRILAATGCLGAIAPMLAWAALRAGEDPKQAPPRRDAVDKAYQAGNFKDAYEGYRKLVLDPKTEPRLAARDFRLAFTCLQRLGRVLEYDEFSEAAIKAHPRAWRVLFEAARTDAEVEHSGFLIGGKFERGPHRGGGMYADATDHDRARALQRLDAALPLLAASPEARGAEAGQFYLFLASALRGENLGYEAWRLQEKTDLRQLPEIEPGSRRMPWMRFAPSEAQGAPVDADGNPVFYKRADNFEGADNDGQRWRWALSMAVESDHSLTNNARFQFANFLRSQFGVQTLARYGLVGPGSDDSKVEEGPFSLRTLKDNETIARLANGVKRFELPDEFNYLLLYRQIREDAKTGLGPEAAALVAGEYEDRRQFDRAADAWKRCIQLFGPGQGNAHQARLDQIIRPWGRFEPAREQAAGKPVALNYRFRNGTRVEFEAWALDVGLLIADVKAYLRSMPAQLDWNRMQVDNIGFRIVSENQNRYVKGPRAAAWAQDLKPPAGHNDAVASVEAPIKQAGAYLVTARMANGNIGRVVVWVPDTALIKKPMAGKSLLYVADAVTGTPVDGADIDFFGWRQIYQQNGRPKMEIAEAKARTNADGLATPDIRQPDQNGHYQYLITARTGAANGRLAFLGWSGIWQGDPGEPVYENVRSFLMTDRPVYRPGQVVHYKFWIARAKYDLPEASEFAGRDFSVEIRDPKGEKVETKALKADAFGGIEGEFTLSNDATLGQYGVQVVNYGGAGFRVEEYKKPEFEVTVDAPDEPIALGEKFEAKITARYLFGSPVANAKVKYKVTRTASDGRWYPPGRWDWLYGAGYNWLGQDRVWYPGFLYWGCFGPRPPWNIRPMAPPEVVAEAEVPIGPDGIVKVSIDSALAKALHGDQDHRYQITAEVTDQSRRTIVGQGGVLAARRPLQVVVWLNRGHLQAGDTAEAHASIRSADGQPVAGTGVLRLLKVSYDAQGKPSEKPVESWESKVEDGQISQKFLAADAGQYRLSLEFSDETGHKQEGGQLFSVLGPGAVADSFRYNALELIPDRDEYRPGDKVRLLVNVDKPGATVLLFVRPRQGAYPAPRVIRMDGRSHLEDIEIAQGDMPNFFVEAVTVADAKMSVETRQIVVPPEKRVADVAIEPESPEYLPGGKARLSLKLTGADGKPFAGSTALTVYDKAVEYISGGSNVPEIRATFWGWKRDHFPQTETSLGRYSDNLLRPNEVAMGDIGTFGSLLEDPLMKGGAMRAGMPGAPTAMFARSGRMGGGMGGLGAAPAAAAPAPMEAMEAGADARRFAFDAEPEANLGAVKFKADAGGGAADVEPTVRTNFADTAYWSGSVVADADGKATIEFDLPESLTTWKIRGWTLGPGTRVGQAESQVITRKNLLVRLQAPRFFVQKDEVVLSANVHNELKNEKAVKIRLELGNSLLEPMDDAERTVTIAAGGETRVDWRVKVVGEGQAVVRMKALTDEESDAVEMKFPAYVHGMLKTESYSAAIRPDQETASIKVRLPEERRPESTLLEIRYSPTLAGAMVDAIPYLADYPYGCTEQTLNRFLPTAIAEKVLIDMGLDLSAIRAKRTNLNAQEVGDPAERMRKWARPEHNPVFDEAEVRKMAKEGLERLVNMQCADGGWGWFSGTGEHSYPHTTAVVVHGLQIARKIDLDVPQGVLERGIAWLEKYQSEQIALIENAKVAGRDEKKLRWKERADDMDALAFQILTEAGKKSPKMLEYLDRDRVELSVRGKALFGMALHDLGEKDKLAVVMQNIAQFLVVDEENQTAHLKLPETGWWFWYNSENEVHATYLKLLARTDPQGPVASKLVKYLVNNRRNATYWDSTRDTALCIEALADYMKATGEDRPDQTVIVSVDGQEKARVKIDANNLFAFENSVRLGGEALASGKHAVEVRREGKGPLYCNAYLTNFTLEDPIGKAGLEVKVDRKVYRLIPEDATKNVAGSRGQVVGQKVEKYRREELESGAALKSGDLVEVELLIDSKNDYEYLVFEDMKAAGFEPVEVRSGYNGNAMGAYVEFRDERVAFFIRRLALGHHSVSYRLRAEIPGQFSALPARAGAMYAPELKGNSGEIKLRIED